MKLGINHKILANDPKWDVWSASVATWADEIRLDSHMDAYAWRVAPDTTYAAGNRPFDDLMKIANWAATNGIMIDYIRDGSPPVSPEWTALGGDWSTMSDGDWRNNRLPKQAWSKTNTWLSYMAKKLTTVKNLGLRWQAHNEQFNRGKDDWAYERLKSVYAQANYSKPWTSPTLFGQRSELVRYIRDWLVLRTYEPAFTKATSLSVNIYPDWQEGQMLTPEDNLMRMLENIYIVSDLTPGSIPIVVSEFAFEDNQGSPAQRLEYSITAAKVMRHLGFDTASLYWDSGRFYLPLEALEEFGRRSKEPMTQRESEIVAAAADSSFNLIL